MEIIVTSVKVFDKNCFGCVKHRRQVMIAYDDPDNLEGIIDIFLTQDQAKDLANDLVIVTERNEAEITKKKYVIEGNHPTLKYVNLEKELLTKIIKLNLI